MLLSPTGSNASLPGGNSWWGRFKTPKGGNQMDLKQPPQPQMSLTRQRLLTLAFGEMETIRMLPASYIELDALARDWVKPPPGAEFSLRVPVEFASLHAARLVSGPYIYLTGEDSYQIAIMGVQGLRVEIAADSPPPPDEPPPPPPPPVLEMPATLNLELEPGRYVALDTTITSDELDMARMEDGTVVDGMFWGKLNIIHSGDTHEMDFSGTRVINAEEISPDVLVDAKLISRLNTATKPPAARCHLHVYSPTPQYCEITLTFSQFWKLGVAWPVPQEGDGKAKYYTRVHPGGAIEHYDTETTTTALYYEAIPDSDLLRADEFISPRHGYAMSFRDFLPHISRVLDQLGLSLQARTNFINDNLPAFSQHKYIAYRFLNPSRIAAAIDISVEIAGVVFTRLFLMFRGLTEEEMGIFDGRGEKEANTMNWREHIRWSELSKDTTQFRILEVSVMELT